MSHAIGKAFFLDGSSFFFEYDGTTDRARQRLFLKEEDLEANWRQDQGDCRCTCGRDELVELAVDYGGGFSYVTSACRHCLVITGETNPREARRLVAEALERVGDGPREDSL